MNLDDIRKDARTTSWFDAGFKSRYCESTCKTAGAITYFVSSEIFPDDKRYYTVRCYSAETGEINNATTFGQYASRSGAVGWLHRRIAA